MPGEDDGIRAEASAWLREHWDPDRSVRDWWTLLAESGWGFPSWPREWFGRGLRAEQAAAAREAFFEVGAGSDLAGLQTRAVREGDEWIVNGQKVWTSGAQYADRGMLLARTDPDAPKHFGLTYFIIDFDQSGIEVRPLHQMNDAYGFNEVFLTDARVSNDRIVGQLNGGWSVALTTLMYERFGGAVPSAQPGKRLPTTRRCATRLADQSAAPRQSNIGAQTCCCRWSQLALPRNTRHGPLPKARSWMKSQWLQV